MCLGDDKTISAAVAHQPWIGDNGSPLSDVSAYASVMDWVGIMIERATGSDLEDHFQKHIFTPLGIKHISFAPSTEDKQKLAHFHQRSGTGEVTEIDHLYRRPLIRSSNPASRRYCAGGHGCFGQPREFLSQFPSEWEREAASIANREGQN